MRDNIHSYDFVTAIDHFYRAPRVGEVYNIGGGRLASRSVIEAISQCEEIAGRRSGLAATLMRPAPVTTSGG